MDSEKQRWDRLRELVLRGLDDALNEAEQGELDALVQLPEGARAAADLLDQVAALGEVPWAAPGSEPISEGLALTSNGTGLRTASGEGARFARPKRWKAGWVAAAIVMLCVSHAFVAHLTYQAALDVSDDAIGIRALGPDSEEFEQQLSTNENDYTLVGMTACVWNANQPQHPLLGDEVGVGDVLNLLDGIAELRIETGQMDRADVRIEGPASVFVRSDGQLGLRSGAMTAEISQGTHDPIVFDTPIGELVVQGEASLGLLASGGENEIHVFAGDAVLVPSWVTDAVDQQVIRAGEGMKVQLHEDKAAVIVMMDASLKRFVSSRLPGFDSLDLGARYEREVLSSEPVAYWRFQEASDAPAGTIPSLGSDPEMQLAIHGDVQWRGYDENRAAVFGLNGEASSLVCNKTWPAKELDEYAIECWFKPVCYHHGEMICMTHGQQLEDSRYAHGLLLEIGARHWRALRHISPNRIRFVHRAPATAGTYDGTHVISEQAYEARMWQHLVAQKQE
ncbi:MAG: hypothetical protein AAGD07_23705, partial [Planctomycetota bacterium]